MAQVIIFTNENGNVSVCVPTGELTIEEVLAKDCPAGAIIVDSASLPEADNDFFNAWELKDDAVTVNLAKAKDMQTANLNAQAKLEVAHRQTNAGIGIDNKLNDADWLALLTAARAAINAATSTKDLRDAVAPVNAAIAANV